MPLEDEIRTLEAQLGKETTELSTSDCAAACKALASIRRAADRICELEAGARCDAARTKAADATKRVHEACPDCAIAYLKKPDEKERAVAPAPAADSPKNAPTVEASEARGGCRNCATASAAPNLADFIVFAIAAVVLGRRLRTKRKKDSNNL